MVYLEKKLSRGKEINEKSNEQGSKLYKNQLSEKKNKTNSRK